MKIAVCQVADAGPVESLGLMLNAAGYEMRLPDAGLRDFLTSLGCSTVISTKHLERTCGYDPVDALEASMMDMRCCDLYVDVKGYRNGPLVWMAFPHLQDKTMWYRINGGEPINHPVHGDEINLNCPILTPNMHYRCNPKAYVMWPPFARFGSYLRRQPPQRWREPVCLIHNLVGWGHADIAEFLPYVKFYGESAPAGLLQHRDVPRLLSTALAMVHLKSNDCPGYALYEAMAACCPLIVSRRLIQRMRMEELFVEGDTCLCFDKAGQTSRTLEETMSCVVEIRTALAQLADPKENQRIGTNAHWRLKELMWNEQRDGSSLRHWFTKNF